MGFASKRSFKGEKDWLKCQNFSNNPQIRTFNNTHRDCTEQILKLETKPNFLILILIYNFKKEGGKPPFTLLRPSS